MIPTRSALRNLEQFIFDKLAASRVPGLSIALVAEDEIIWSRGFGFRDVASGLPATPKTLYAIGSVTKSFTAISILQLAEQGKLSVDDDVYRYLPEFKVRPFGEPIKIWHLLSHSSGLPGLGFSEARFKQAIVPSSLWLPVERHDAIMYFMQDAADWVAAKPGERYFYLNEGFMLLGAIIERVSGLTYNEYVRRNILQPLKMERSSFEYDDYMAAEDRATPYMMADGQQLSKAYVFNPVNAKGGLISSAEDLARYVRMHLNRGELDGVRIMSAKSSQAQQTNRILKVEHDLPFVSSKYGFGLAITDDFYGHKLIAHGGSVSISTSWIGFVPDSQVGVALITNGSGYATSRYGQVALATLLGEDPARLPFMQQDAIYRELCGDYAGYHNTTQVRVSAAGDYLSLSLIDDRGALPGVPLTPVDLTDGLCTFTTLSDGVPMTVEFQREKGRVTLLYERYAYRKKI